jgi:hypothetical protein
MRCFYVLVHGRLKWQTKPPADPDVSRSSGFYCHRYVLAQDRSKAAIAAVIRVRDNFDRSTGWISSGDAELELEAEEVHEAPLRYLLKPDNKGHTFYEGE